VVYLYYIIVSNEIMEEHNKKLTEVFEALRQLKKSKSSFVQTEISFLGIGSAKDAFAWTLKRSMKSNIGKC
jgi:hypothetical protein